MSERFEDLVEEVDSAHCTANSVEALARSARDALARRIKARDFRLDCVERIVNSVASNAVLRGGGPDLHVNERLNYRFKVFFWDPGFVSAPHQHNTWGITGVLHNGSSVLLYRKEDGPGEVGYLVPPCIHSVGNPGDSISATFHLFSDSADEELRPNDTIWYPKPGGKAPAGKKPRYGVLRGSAEMLARIDDARSLRLLERIFSLGGPHIKLICVKAMAAIDPQRTASRRNEFHASLPDNLHEALHTVLSAASLEAPVY
jgi:hypothetical protein